MTQLLDNVKKVYKGRYGDDKLPESLENLVRESLELADGADITMRSRQVAVMLVAVWETYL